MKPKTRKIVSLGLSIFINLFIIIQSLLPAALSSSQSGFFSNPLVSIIEFFRPNNHQDIKPESLEIIGESDVFIGDKVNYTVRFNPSNVSFPSVIWEVNNDLASVNSKGQLTANNVGEVVLTCLYQENLNVKVSKTINIVERPIVMPTELKISVENNEVAVNTSLPLIINTTPMGNYEVIYEISNDCIEIDEFNMIRVLKSGDVSIDAYLKDYPDIRSETIHLICIDEIIVLPSEINILLDVVYVGRTEEPSVSILPDNATDKNYTLISGDETIAVIKNNKVVGKSAGTVDIKVTHGFDKSIIKVITIEVKEVLPETMNLSFSTDEKIIIVGKTVQLRIQMSPSDVTNLKIIWKSSNESIAKVDNNGLIYGIKEGEFTLTATSVSNSSLSVSRIYKVEKASSLGSTQRAFVGNLIRKVIGHFGLYAISGLLTTWCLFEYIKSVKKASIVSISIGGVLGISTEIIQQIPSGRAPGTTDMLINVVGFICGLCFYWLMIKYFGTSKKKIR